MNDYLSSLGRMLIFSTFLPGALACATFTAVFPKIGVSSFNIYQFLMLVYGLGFFANGIGHFSEHLISKIFKKWPHTPYEDLLPILPDIDPHLAQMFTRDIDYLECLHVWYWNSAVAILGVAIAKFLAVFKTADAFTTTTLIIVIGSFLVAPLLLYLSFRQQVWNYNRVQSLKQSLIDKNKRMPNKPS